MGRFWKSGWQQQVESLLAAGVQAGVVTPEAAREELCRLNGICSEGACDQPIVGACDRCGIKLCATHLTAHERAAALAGAEVVGGIRGGCRHRRHALR